MNPLASHHNEWKSLLDISGPFLSLPVLLEVFASGLDIIDSEITSNLRSAYEEWLNERDDVAIHSAWIDYVIENLLGYSQNLVLRGQGIPNSLTTYIPHQVLTLRPSMVLTDPTTGQPRLLIQKYHHTQKLDRPPFSETSMSCLTRMMELLHATQVPMGLITNGEEWVLVHASVGETSSYISFYSHLWLSENLTLRAFYSLLKLSRFFGVRDEETLPQLFKRSSENQHEITDLLGNQVRSSVHILVQAFDRADQDSNRKLLKDIKPDSLYEAALTVMMRLVFLLFAEERELLPINELVYNQNYAISTLSDQLRTESDRLGEEVLERHYDAWSRILSTSRLVFSGVRHDHLNMPAYGGSLFDPDRFAFLEGREHGSSWQGDQAKPLLIDNRTVLHILDSIQYLYIREYGQRQRLSFRALDIEQIGHIYEGLLEYKASRANDIMVGLVGNKEYPLPIIGLAELEKWLERGNEEFAKQLKELTGKSPASIKKTLNKPIEIELSNRLQNACNHQGEIYQRILPFAGLVAVDDYGNLLVIQPGSIYVSRGTTRRATGTHYTPRSLTEPIVQHTLEPIIYHGPAEGLPEDQWTLKTPSELLNLKICDMAMGSGSFLVQVIRYLSERLIESWQIIAPLVDPGQQIQSFVTPEGKKLENPTGEELPNDLDARYLLARRLIADRCIYGVDKNPLAVEMGKLSIWLITLDKNRPFTFLDHALKCGDSLVGVDEEDFLHWARSRSNTSTWSLFDEELKKELENARAKRRELEAFQVRDMTDLAMKEDLLRQADEATERIKLGCDLLVGARLQGLSEKDLQAEESILLGQWMAGETEDNYCCQVAKIAAKEVRAFHWFLEFPEVFEKGGFNALVGNPPFMGGKKISGSTSVAYLLYIKDNFKSSGATTDLCAYFFLRAFVLLSVKGFLGLLATNTISQGDTRKDGLRKILTNKGVIYEARKSFPWPGQASLEIASVHITNQHWGGPFILDGNPQNHAINEVLDSSLTSTYVPKRLKVNEGKYFMGTIILGGGFLLEAGKAQEYLIQPDYSKVIMPFMNGDDLASRPDVSPSRYVINFGDLPETEAKAKYPDLYNLVLEKVKPQRAEVKRKKYRENWWQFAEQCSALYKTTKNYQQVLICGNVTKYLNFVFVPNTSIYSANLFVFTTDNWLEFACLQSDIHETFVRTYGSTLETRLCYSPKEVFLPFPFPDETIEDPIAANYHAFRNMLMQKNQIGLTDLFNRFHDSADNDPELLTLREMKIGLNEYVKNLYGWSDLEFNHDYYASPQGIRFTISEAARKKVLSRLIDLNHQRHEEETQVGLLGGPKFSKTNLNPIQTIAKPVSRGIKVPVQIGLGLPLEPEPEHTLEIEPRPADSIPIDQLERWSWYRCASCGSAVVGINAEDHIKEKHGNVDVGFLLPKTK